jgi:hypothetical protein
VRLLLLLALQLFRRAGAIGALELIGWGGETHHVSQQAEDETDEFPPLNPDQVCSCPPSAAPLLRRKS